MMLNRFAVVSLFLILALVALSCAAPAAPVLVTPAAGDQPTPAQSGALTPVALGLGFIPSVQFAPFYVAQAKGFFTEQGLDVTLQHGIETDFLKLVGVNQMQFAVGSGDQVILGRAQGLPLTYTLAWYRQFPVTVMSLADKGLNTPQALEGRRVGIPGLFGASLVAWKALVYATGLDESQVTLESIGFTQAAAVSQDRVDAALDYVTNGPVQLRLAGQEVNIIRVSDYIDLPSNGLITNAQTVAENPELVQRMTNARCWPAFATPWPTPMRPSRSACKPCPRLAAPTRRPTGPFSTPHWRCGRSRTTSSGARIRPRGKRPPSSCARWG
jgi:NitT/TauT family transport system substrate-binding protein